jgi:hypothetical protein
VCGALAPLQSASGSLQPLHSFSHILFPTGRSLSTDTILQPSALGLPSSVSLHALRSEDIPPLSAGLQLKDNYIFRNRLHDLLNMLSGISFQLTSTAVFGHVIPPLPSALDLDSAVRHVFQCIAVDCVMPQPDLDEQSLAMHILISSITLYCSRARTSSIPDPDIELLWHSVVDCSVTLLKNASMAAAFSSINPSMTILDIHWFSLMLILPFAIFCPSSLRLELLHKRFEVLVEQLLGIDPAQTLGSILDQPKDTVYLSSFHSSLSIWICIIHISLHPAMIDHLPLWATVNKVIMNNDYGSHLERSEAIWTCVYSLCTIAQFDSHGCVAKSMFLPSSWPTILLALNNVRLKADLNIDCHLHQDTLQKRDDYLRLLVSRCLTIYQRWSWSLADYGVTIVAILQQIFSSRQFANLLGESAMLPLFVKHRNPNLILASSEQDTAFAMWLKLIVFTSSNVSSHTQVKRLIALSLPVSVTSISNSTIPSTLELSMLCNRFSAAAITLVLQINCPDYPFSHSTLYISRFANFSSSSYSVRSIMIDALACAGTFSQTLGRGWSEISSWFINAITVLTEELQIKNYHGSAKLLLTHIVSTLPDLFNASVQQMSSISSLFSCCK